MSTVQNVWPCVHNYVDMVLITSNGWGRMVCSSNHMLYKHCIAVTVNVNLSLPCASIPATVGAL